MEFRNLIYKYIFRAFKNKKLSYSFVNINFLCKIYVVKICEFLLPSNPNSIWFRRK